MKKEETSKDINYDELQWQEYRKKHPFKALLLLLKHNRGVIMAKFKKLIDIAVKVIKEIIPFAHIICDSIKKIIDKFDKYK